MSRLDGRRGRAAARPARARAGRRAGRHGPAGRRARRARGRGDHHRRRRGDGRGGAARARGGRRHERRGQADGGRVDRPARRRRSTASCAAGATCCWPTPRRRCARPGACCARRPRRAGRLGRARAQPVAGRRAPRAGASRARAAGRPGRARAVRAAAPGAVQELLEDAGFAEVQVEAVDLEQRAARSTTGGRPPGHVGRDRDAVARLRSPTLRCATRRRALRLPATASRSAGLRAVGGPHVLGATLISRASFTTRARASAARDRGDPAAVRARLEPYEAPGGVRPPRADARRRASA